jgi:predicted transcriptional regulator
MAWAMDHAPEELTSTQRHVLLVLANYVNDETRTAYPSLGRLARQTGLSERAVRMSLRALEGAGLISTKMQGAVGSGGKTIPADRRPNLYRWLAEELRGEPDAPREVDGGNVVPQRGERGAPRGGNDVPPNLHRNHQKNHLLHDERELSMRSVVEALRETVPDAAAWLGKKALPALERGWLPYDIAKAVLAEPMDNARSVSAILAARLEDLGMREPTRPALKMAWCGKCDERTRFIEVADDKVARCPDCHPSAQKAAAV